MFDLLNYAKELKIDYLDKIMPWFEYEERIEKTKNILKDNNLDIGIAYGSEFRPGDIGWLCGYDPVVESSIVVVGPNKSILLGGPSFINYAKRTSPGLEYRLCRELAIKEDYSDYDFYSFFDILKEANKQQINKIGILTPADVITNNILEMIKSATSAEIVVFDEYLLKSRYIKSKNEQEMIRIATKISDWAMEAAVRTAKPGIRELEVSAAAEYIMKFAGSARTGVMTVVMSGNRISEVGATGTNKIINEGELVTISCSARWEGLTGITGRTFVAGGEPDSDQEAFLAYLERAFNLAIDQFKYASDASKIDSIPREFLKSNGLTPFYSTVHNTGWTECMEGYGGFTSYSDCTIPKDIAHMIDIGVFNIPFRNLKSNEVGGRIEDTIIINQNGNTEHINSLPLRLEYLQKNS